VPWYGLRYSRRKVRIQSSCYRRPPPCASNSARPGAYKRVHFAPQPVVSYLSFHSDTALSTWYGDEDYELFLADCCHTVRKAQDLLAANGDWSGGLDPAQESLLGLEHFLSPTLERERKERCKRHVHKMLAAQSGNDSGNHGKIATGVAPNKTKTFVP
jgi:hypothetical protein